MPKCNVDENYPRIESLPFLAAHRYIHISNNPFVIAPVPLLPHTHKAWSSQCAFRIILLHLHVIPQCPQPKKTPNRCKFHVKPNQKPEEKQKSLLRLKSFIYRQIYFTVDNCACELEMSNKL